MGVYHSTSVSSHTCRSFHAFFFMNLLSGYFILGAEIEMRNGLNFVRRGYLQIIETSAFVRLEFSFYAAI